VVPGPRRMDSFVQTRSQQVRLLVQVQPRAEFGSVPVAEEQAAGSRKAP